MNPAERIRIEIRHEAEEIAHETAELCRKELALTRHELPFRRSWRFETRLSWSARRTRSRGGLKGVSLAMLRHTPDSNWNYSFYEEYARIAADPCIGTVASPDWRHAIKAVAAHEVAHVAQHRIAFMPRAKRGLVGNLNFNAPHGEGWRRLYAILRAAVVNPEVRRAGGWIGGRDGRDKAAGLWALPSLGEIEEKTGLPLRVVDQKVSDKHGSGLIRHLAFGQLKRPIKLGRNRRHSWTRFCDGAADFRLSNPDWPVDQSVATLATCRGCLLAVHEARTGNVGPAP